LPSEPFDESNGPLAPYLGGDGAIRACPTLDIDLPEDDPRRFEKNCGGYGYNLAFIGRQLKDVGWGFYGLETDLVGTKNDQVRDPSRTLMFADSAFTGSGLIEYSFAEPRFFPTFGTRADPSIHFRHGARRANVKWCDGHVASRVMTFTWTSGLYTGEPGDFNVGWFGDYDDNGYFDLE
jgi:prepilin-type processing-associated H-X9-DG protein